MPAMMDFNSWVPTLQGVQTLGQDNQGASRGYGFSQDEGGPVRPFSEDQSGQLQSQYNFLTQPDRAGNLPFGTNISGLRWNSPYMATTDPISFNGQQYMRTGEDMRSNPEVGHLISDTQYDPEHGYLTPYADYLKAAKLSQQKHAGDLSDIIGIMGPLLVAGGFGGIAAGAAGAGAAGATAGAAGEGTLAGGSSLAQLGAGGFTPAATGANAIGVSSPFASGAFTPTAGAWSPTFGATNALMSGGAGALGGLAINGLGSGGETMLPPVNVTGSPLPNPAGLGIPAAGLTATGLDPGFEGGNLPNGGEPGAPEGELQKSTVNPGETKPMSLLDRLTGGMDFTSPQSLLRSLASQLLSSSSSGNGGGSSSGFGGNSWLNTIMSLGSGVYGLSESERLKKLAQSAGQQADPFGPYRPQFAAQLSDLMKDPSSVTKYPGYDAGLQAVERKMASQGYNGSGNMMTALQKYGGDFFDQAVGRLSGLAGAGFNPASAAQLQLSGSMGATDLASRSLASIGYGLRGKTPAEDILSMVLRSA